jgi:hypothetical protein
MSDSGTSLETGKDAATPAVEHARRSTRVFQAVPLSVSGQNRIGNLFLESTSAVSVNCHGCLYPSRNEYRHGSWVTIEVPNQQVNSLPRPVRAQVKFVRLPSSPQELYLVGVEFENPANVWGIKGVPEDWLQFPNFGSATALPSSTSTALVPAGVPVLPATGEQKIHILPVVTENASAQRECSSSSERPLDAQTAGTTVATGATGGDPAATPASTSPATIAVAPEQLLRLIEGKLQQAAEKAVSTALTARLNTAVNQAVKAIENFSQASLRQVEAHCSQYRETLVASAREDLLGRMKADLSEAGDELRSQVEAFSSKTLETVHNLEKTVGRVQPIVEAAQTSLQTTAGEVQEHFSARLREAADRATSEFTDEAGRLSQRQLARLTEKAHAAGGEAARAIDARSGEARLQLESAAGAALGEFHERAGIEIDLAVSESRKTIEASLESIAAAATIAAQERQHAAHEQLVRATEQNMEHFRQRLTKIANSSLIAAMSAVNEHSSTLLQTLTKEAQEVQKTDTELPAGSQVAAD